jgi:hypothetical protein
MWGFIAMLTRITNTLNETLYWTVPQWEDVEHTEYVAAVVDTGEIDIDTVTCLTFTLAKSQLGTAEAAVARGEGLQISWQTPPFFATILGKTFDLGPYITRVIPDTLEPLSSTNDATAATVLVKLTTTRPVRFVFERFHPSLARLTKL